MKKPATAGFFIERRENLARLLIGDKPSLVLVVEPERRADLAQYH